jgi:hypothetical protein
MKKLLLIFTILLFFNYAYSQTIDITKISITTSSNPQWTDYDENPTEIYTSINSFTVQQIDFAWKGFDPDIQQIYFSIWQDDGYNKTQYINFSYPGIAIGTADISGAPTIYNTIPRDINYTIQASYYDDNNQLQFIAESDPWTITRTPDPGKAILNNKICCNQTTISFPFDPGIINQDNSVIVSTQDGAAITSIQWQINVNFIWSNISGATQMYYDPPSITGETYYRRVLTSSSGAVSISPAVNVTKLIEKIAGNSICCSQTTSVMPFDPATIHSSDNTVLTSNIQGTTFTYQWQKTNAAGNFVNISGATDSSYDPPHVQNPTLFRRVATSSNGISNISNPIGILLQSCNRPQDQQNLICGDQTFYKVQHGDTINPGIILGAYNTPDIIRREFGYDYMISYDGINWFNVQSRQLLSVNDNSRYALCGRRQNPNPVVNTALTPLVNTAWWLITTLLSPSTAQPSTDPVIQIVNKLLPQDATNVSRSCAINNGLLDYQPHSLIFDATKGAVQKIYIRRDYYHWYDEFNCGPFNLPGPCGSSWTLMNTSNIATITLTTGDFPKPVPPITSNRNNVTCNWSDQTLTFSVPQLNNQESYKWTIPSTWTSYTLLEGPYANQISVNTNSGDGNFAKGGQVCLEVTQGSQTDRQCITIAGSSPTNVFIPATINACEGKIVVIKPVLVQNNAIINSANYNFSWTANQSQNITCGNPSLNDCKELSLTVSNVRQYPTQAISVTVRDNLGCKSTANTTLVTTPGLQMGILNSYSDPKALSNSGLAINTVNNHLYFTGENKNIYRSYYDNTPGQLIWKYVPLKDKNNNQAIISDGPVAYYKGATDKLFYVRNSNLYYAESADNGVTWIDKFSSGYIAQHIDARIKIYGTNIYYIDNTTRQLSYINVTTTSPSVVLIGIDQVNYSQRMFTVEDGVLAYADVNNNIVAFNANTGVRLNINVPAQIKQVNYNSSISIYNGNIYYTSASGTLRIIKRNTSTGVYDNYEEVLNLQLAGPFAINKQTGTVYAKAYDVLGKQIYYLNSKWNILPINNPLSYSAIQSDMTYTNEHAYYIGDHGYLSNTYYIAPCVPEVLRTSHTFNAAGDILNDPLSTDITEDHSILFYPNPTTGIVKATVTIQHESNIQIKIIPVTGSSSDIIYNASIQSGTQEIPFDMSTYAVGIYIVQIYVDGSLYAKSKLIKY